MRFLICFLIDFQAHNHNNGVFDFMVIDNTCHLHDIWVSNLFPYKYTMVFFIAIVYIYILLFRLQYRRNIVGRKRQTIKTGAVL